jgi:hypothetical protein
MKWSIDYDTDSAHWSKGGHTNSFSVSSLSKFAEVSVYVRVDLGQPWPIQEIYTAVFTFWHFDVFWLQLISLWGQSYIKNMQQERPQID